MKRANTVGKVNKPTKAQTRKLRKVKMGKSTAKSIASKAPTKPTTVTKNVITNKPVAVNNVPVGVITVLTINFTFTFDERTTM